MSIKVTKKLVMVAEAPNDEGIIYSREELLGVVEKYKDSRVFGSFYNANEPNNFDIEKLAIECYNLVLEGNALICDFTILDTHYGVTAQTILNTHSMVLTPTGKGNVDSSGNVTGYELISIDIKLA